MIRRGHSVIIVDNLINSNIETLRALESLTKASITFYNFDICDEDALFSSLGEIAIDGIIHLAGYKSSLESIKEPLMYYYNNINCTLALLKFCKCKDIQRFVFSSSATVYGDGLPPYSEEMEIGHAMNPYGETKIICEKILSDFVYANPSMGIVSLRYFNPVGSDESYLIGENPKGIPNNIMPLIVRVAGGEQAILSIYGNDYNTPDGTGVRDYIHVTDLASGHISAIESPARGYRIFNLGTGVGISVLQLVQTFERINNVKINYEFAPRRFGDVAISYSNVEKALNELNWKAERDIEQMCRDSWEYYLASRRKR